MKRFEFSLERIRQWRQKQVDLEELRLEALLAERRAMEDRRIVLKREFEDAALVLQAPAVDAGDLLAWDRFHTAARIREAALGQSSQELEKRIQAQLARLAEARRGWELLNHLRDRQQTEWRREFDKELDAEAADSYLARWSRR